MPLYEKVFIARQDISPNELEKIVENYTNIITEMNGEVVNRENWGLRNLAYTINKYRKGHYVMLVINAPAEAVKEISRLMAISEDIIRDMTITIDKIPNEPSPMMNQHSGRNNQPIIDVEIEEVVEGEE